MRTDLCDIDDAITGQVFLDDDGTLRFEGAALNIRDTIVIGPDGAKTEADGADYLRALPYTFRSPYCHAIFVP